MQFTAYVCVVPRYHNVATCRNLGQNNLQQYCRCQYYCCRSLSQLPRLRRWTTQNQKRIFLHQLLWFRKKATNKETGGGGSFYVNCHNHGGIRTERSKRILLLNNKKKEQKTLLIWLQQLRNRMKKKEDDTHFLVATNKEYGRQRRKYDGSPPWLPRWRRWAKEKEQHAPNHSHVAINKEDTTEGGGSSFLDDHGWGDGQKQEEDNAEGSFSSIVQQRRLRQSSFLNCSDQGRGRRGMQKLDGRVSLSSIGQERRWRRAFFLDCSNQAGKTYLRMMMKKK